MAIRYSHFTPMIIQKSTPNRRPVSMVVTMSADNRIPANSMPSKIRLPSRSKVFEDQSKGIVCYREANGEITCEGFDEGPRFHHHQSFSRFTTNPRDAEIIDLLKKNWLQIVDGGKLP